MKSLLVLWGLLIPMIVHSQEINLAILFQVVNQKEEPVPYATAVFLDENQKVSAYGVSDEEGSFLIALQHSGTYRMEISCVGYETLRDSITLTADTKGIIKLHIKEGLLLDEAVVKGGNPLRALPDRIVYDVDLDTTAYRSSAMQIIEKLPFISIDRKSGRLEVMGGGNYTITVNGKKDLFLSEANQYVARLLQADKMQQVELVLNPTGRYENKTAVINIVTKGSLPDGVVGEIAADLNYEMVRPSISLTSKIKKFVYNIGYDTEYSFYHKLDVYNRMTNYTNDALRWTEVDKTEWSRDNKHHMSLNTSYDLASSHLLTLSGDYAFYRERVYSDEHTVRSAADHTVVSAFDTRIRNVLKDNSFNGALNYQKNFGDNPFQLLTATYRVEHNKDNDRFLSRLFDEEYPFGLPSPSQNRLNLTEHTVGVDYSHPLNDLQSFYVTAKGVFRHYGSENIAFDDDGQETGRNTPLDYDQSVYSLAGNYTLRYKKFAIVPRIAFETTANRMHFGRLSDMQRKNFFTVIPQLSILYQIKKKSTIQLVYNRPAFRPDVNFLNPFVNDTDPNHILVGNPTLKPENKHVVKLKYRLAAQKFNMNLSASYSSSNNAVYAYDFINEDGIRTTTYGNIGKSEILSFKLFARYNLPERFEITLEGSANHSRYRNAGSTYPLWNFKANATATVYITPKIYAQALGFLVPLSTSLQSSKYHYYIGYTLRAGYNISPRLSLVLDVEKFLKKHLTVEEERSTPDFHFYERRELYGRTVSLSFTYTFGRLKSSVRESSRSITNQDRSR